MPWCPQCKNEYRKGIKQCSDCKCDLVDELEEERGDDENRPIMVGEENKLKEVIEFLEANEIKTARIEYVETDETNEVFVDKEEREKAIQLTYIYVKEKMSKEPREEKEVVYVSASDKASDVKSSGYVLISVGSIGLIALLLIIFKIIPINMTVFSMILTGSIMSATFLVFIIMGVQSLRKVKLLKKEACEEDKRKEALDNFVEKFSSGEMVDNELVKITDKDVLKVDEQKLYFIRTAYLRKIINEEFPDYDPNFVEEYIESLYSRLYD